MHATVFAKQGQYGLEINDGKEPTIPWTPLENLDQDMTLNDHLLNLGLAPVGQWNVRNTVSRVQLKWATSPATLLGVVSPQTDTDKIEYIE